MPNQQATVEQRTSRPLPNLVLLARRLRGWPRRAALKIVAWLERRGCSGLRARLRADISRTTERVTGTLPDRWVWAWVRLRLPRTGQVEATVACNLRCPLCVTHLMPRAAKFFEAAWLESLLEEGGSRLRFLCFHLQGEPLLHPHLHEMVRRCREYGVETSYGTNGMRIAGHVDGILESELGTLSIAIDGRDAESYARYRQGGDLDQVVAGTRALLEQRRARGLTRPYVRLQMIMFPYNEEQQAECLSFLEGIGADEVVLKRPSYFFDLREAERRGLEIDVEAKSRPARAFLESLGESVEEQSFDRDQGEGRPFRERKLCPQLERLNVLADGRVVACCMDAMGVTSFGSLAEEGLRKIWRGERHRDLIRRFQRGQLDICEHCTLR